MARRKIKLKKGISKFDRIQNIKLALIKRKLTPRMRIIKKRFEKHRPVFTKTLSMRLAPRLISLNKEKVTFFLKRNVLIKTFFIKILRRSILQKSLLKRTKKKKQIFTKRKRKDRKFFLKTRRSLIETKKFLYRKQFPKINGKKNRKFNFDFYNNLHNTRVKFVLGRIVITYLNNNTFVNIHNGKKMLKVYSAGTLGFKGPKRSTPYSRQVVVRKAVKFLLKTNLNILDIYLNSNYNRWYYFLFKEFSKPKVKPYTIRYLVSNNPRAHGFLRDKKHRRK